MRNRKSRLKIRKFSADSDKDYDGPSKMSMARRNRDKSGTGNLENYKEFSDLLGPLNRWLQSQIGRPWDEVYSEICRSLPATVKEPIRHIWEIHIKPQIAMNCRMGTDGKVYRHFAYRYRRRGESDWEVVEDTFYVHPVTKLFLFAKPKPIRRPKRTVGNGLKIATEQKSNYDWKTRIHTSESIDKELGITWPDKTLVLLVDKTTRAVLLNGIWYLYFYRQHSLSEVAYVKNESDGMGCILRRGVTYGEDRTVSRWYEYKKKQMNGEELRKYGLSNSPPR